MPRDDPTPPFARGADAVAQALGTDSGSGLGRDEAARRLQSHGRNTLRRQKKKSLLAILLHQFESVIAWLLAAASAMSFALGNHAEAVAILMVFVVNGAIGFFTELRAVRSTEALMRIAEVRARVRRGGDDRIVKAERLVPGDLVLLEAGDVVTADLRLCEANALQADESVLTGESTPVAKAVEPVAADAPVGDRASMAFKGTAITQGAGAGIVVATGMDTEIGRISELAQSAESETAPLERRLDRLGHRLIWLALGLAAATMAAAYLRGQDLEQVILTGVALAVAAVPEGLPVVATLTLARGMWRMSRRNAVITQLSTVETLGSTTVILTDKTGTLTENRMSVVRYLLRDVDVEARADDGGLSFRTGEGAVTPDEDDRLAWVLRVGALCNNADLGDGTEAERAGDPMEIALLEAAARAGLAREELRAELPERREHAFDPERKMMATVHAEGEGARVAVKGAPEAVLAACSRVLGPSGATDLTDAAREDWRRRNAEAARDGLRLLALATKRAPDAGADPYRDLTLLGLVCLLDPVRAGVPEAIADARAAGVRVVMLTGDHADTAETIAANAGLGDGALTVIRGGELAGRDVARMSAEERDRLLAADVFARVAPETKLTLVSAYQEAGHVVAMTGDGVNDAPALKKADIGIAMGRRGTEVAKQAAHMVLRDDAFDTIIAAMRQGRVIFGNIRNIVVYLLSCNVSEVLVVGLAVGGGLPAPLLPLQILYLNLVTDVFPAFALGLGRGEAQVMARPPRDPGEAIVDRPRWQVVAVLGSFLTVATLGAFVLALAWLKLDAASAVTVAFLALALGQLWNVFNMRDPGSGLLRNEITRNPYVWGAIALCLGLVGLAVWQPALGGVLQLASPGAAGLGLAVLASFVPLALGQVWIALRRRRQRAG